MSIIRYTQKNLSTTYDLTVMLQIANLEGLGRS